MDRLHVWLFSYVLLLVNANIIFLLLIHNSIRHEPNPLPEA